MSDLKQAQLENYAKDCEAYRTMLAILREALERIEARKIASLESVLMVVAELQEIAREALRRAEQGGDK